MSETSVRAPLHQVSYPATVQDWMAPMPLMTAFGELQKQLGLIRG